MLFIVNVTYLKVEEGGDEPKKMNERYVVDAVSVTDSEAKVKKWMPSNYKESEIKSSGLAPMSEIVSVNFDKENDIFFLGRAFYLEETKKKPKKKTISFMINGKENDLQSALEMQMHGMVIFQLSTILLKWFLHQN